MSTVYVVTLVCDGRCSPGCLRQRVEARETPELFEEPEALAGREDWHHFVAVGPGGEERRMDVCASCWEVLRPQTNVVGDRRSANVKRWASERAKGY